MYQSNPVGVELFSDVNVTYIVHRNISQESETSHFLIYSGESSIGFGRREEATQLTVKLQLSIDTKNHTHFVKTCLQGF